MNVKWCCPAFRANHSMQADRGIFVVATDPNADTFYVAAQAGAEDDQRKLKEQPLDVPISVRLCVMIHYCPWCGAHLKKHYSTSNRLPAESAPCTS